MPSFISNKIVKVVSAKEFLRIMTQERDTVMSSRIIYPELGSCGLGKFVVEIYKYDKLHKRSLF